MKNNRLLLGVGTAIVFALYNILVFTFADNYTSVFWFTYGFTVLAFILQVVAFAVSYGRKTIPDNMFSGIPLTVISIAYFCVQLFVSIIFMIFADMSLKIANVIQIVILIVYIIVCIAFLFGRNTINGIDDETKDKLLFIKLLENDVIALQERTNNPAFNTRLENLAELIKYSDPMSHPSLSLIEQKITAKINQLIDKAENSKIAEFDELCNEIELLMADRNRKCKILK